MVLCSLGHHDGSRHRGFKGVWEDTMGQTAAFRRMTAHTTKTLLSWVGSAERGQVGKKRRKEKGKRMTLPCLCGRSISASIRGGEACGASRTVVCRESERDDKHYVHGFGEMHGILCFSQQGQLEWERQESHFEVWNLPTCQSGRTNVDSKVLVLPCLVQEYMPTMLRLLFGPRAM